MDRQSLAIFVRAAQIVVVLAGSLALGAGLSAYSRLLQLAQTGTSMTSAQLSKFPDSLRWHVSGFVAGIVVMWLLERIYRRLQPNNSFKLTPDGGPQLNR